MKNIRTITAILVYLMVQKTSFAQNNGSVSNSLMPSIDNFAPPSPSVTALNKFGDIPVGPSTGIPSVSVPIYSWKGKTFGRDLSVSLDYHAGGVKVDEIASDVGLGWALNAGGVVSRVVRGIYDEQPIYGFLDKAMPASNTEGNAGAPENTRMFNRMSAGLEDSQCDLFNYSFNGRNGHFVLGKNNDILMIEETRIKVNVTINNNNFHNKPLITKITITDEEGYRYVYNDHEMTENYQSLISSKYTSAWYLSEIIHPAGKDKITFTYGDYYTHIVHRGGYTSADPIVGPINMLPFASGGDSQLSTNCKRITGISFPDGNQIVFAYQPTNRQDIGSMSTAKLLEKITINKGTVKFGYRLAHDYSISGRATLISVTEFGGINEIPLKPYSFVYSTTTLPARLSGAVDHWGYANWNNGSIIPEEYFRVSGGEFPPYKKLLGGNRDTHYERVLAGSMKQINYPTGGYTVFEMEANQAKHEWLEQNIPVTIQLPPFTDRTMNESINGTASYNQVPFTFRGENSTTTQFKVTTYPDASSNASSVRFELYNSSNQLLNTQVVNFPNNNINPIEHSFQVMNLIKNANYYFRIYCLNLPNYYNYTQIDWREINPGGTHDTVLRHVQPYVGGIRAKRISDYASLGTQPAKVREYDYTLEDGVTSSGSLGFRPVYTYLASYDYRISNLVVEDVYYGGPHNLNYIIRTSGGVQAPLFVNGSPVTYSRVTERVIGATGSLGKTVRLFTNFNESSVYVSESFPFVPPQIPSYYYGKLKREEVYDSNNRLLRTVDNTYKPITDRYTSSAIRVENFRSIVFAPVKFFWNGNPHIPKIDPSGKHHYYLMNSFSPLTGRMELTNTVSTDFISGQSPLVTTTNNSYDPNYFYLKETSRTDSRGRETKTQLNYPRDMVVAGVETTIYQGMLDANVISPVIEEKVFVAGVQQTSISTQYQKWHNSFFSPAKVQTKKMNLAVEDRIVYLEYDTHGAPLAAQQMMGPKTAYIWGYGGTQLIAQLVNIDYANVRTLLGGANAVEVFRNKTAPTDSEIDMFLQPLLVALPAEATINQFKYHTLQGMTSNIDVAGRKTSYEYDEYNRLKAIRDQDGKLVEAYQYNYGN